MGKTQETNDAGKTEECYVTSILYLTVLYADLQAIIDSIGLVSIPILRQTHEKIILGSVHATPNVVQQSRAEPKRLERH